MKEITVKIRYDNTTANFTARDIHHALVHLFGINTNFEVEEVDVKKEAIGSIPNK